MHKYRPLLVYCLLFQMLLVAFGVPVFVRHCQMPNMKKEISLFSQKDNCCKKKNTPKHCKKNNIKQKSKPLNPCCTFQSEVWQADVETPTNAEANISPIFLLLCVLPCVFGGLLYNLKKFFSFFYQKKLFRNQSNPPPLPKIPNWLRFRNIIR